jgi:DNA-binding HxlR family transcriptional regulator
VIKNGRYVFGKECERVAELLQLVGNKWSVLVVVLLGLGPRRFNDLRRSIPGISQRMLTRTLRELEQTGLVERTVTVTIPPHVSYGLTNLGVSLSNPVRSLCDWALAHVAAIDSARTRFAKRYG